MPALPFSIRRVLLLVRGAFLNRDTPRLRELAAISNPEVFVWTILPHAARSFAPSILLLPEHAAREAAVGYLYARMLDTYEDLSPSPQEAREALQMFAERFSSSPPSTAPKPPLPVSPDNRDRAHLLLVERHHMVDSVFLQLDKSARSRVTRLVTDMACGMSEFSEVFENQGGVLKDEQQVLDYCHRVIGLPALFVMELLLGDIITEHETDALEVSELVQLANITRDVEKDLSHGIAYHPALQPFLGSDSGVEASAAVFEARRDLMLLATRRGGAFRRLISAVNLPGFSPARAAAVLMMLFTDRHYRACALRVGIPTWSGPRRMLTMILASLPASFSRWWADRILRRVERDLLAAA